MSSRERILAWVLGLALTGALLYVSVAMVIFPLLDQSKSNRALAAENAELEANYDARQAQNKRVMASILPRSLPADLDLGKREYESALGRLLTESKVPAGFTLREKSADGKGIPELAKNRPAYTKIAFTITMTKVDIGTLMAFLKRYYDLNLLHQITTFTIKRDDTSSIAQDKRQAKDRTDLNVTLVTEAIMLDGAPSRKTLLSAPVSAGSVLGGAGLYSMENSNPQIGRGIAPYSLVQVLATSARDYVLVTARDILHGQLPAPPVVKAKEKEKEKEIVPPGPDISPYIRLVSIVKSSDGSAHIELTDLWNNFDFEINLAQKGEKLMVKAIRYKKEKQSDKSPNGRVVDKDFPGGGLLAFSDEKSRTKHLFKIYGIDGTALVLSETAGQEPKAAPPKFGQRPTKPSVDPKPALLGGLFVAAPALPKVEKFYRWEVGVPLKDIKEMKADEAQKAIQRALGGLLEVSGAASDPKEREVAPPPVVPEDDM
jgi:hypothetical protein